MLPFRILSVVALSLLLATVLLAASATRNDERVLVAQLLAFGRFQTTPAPTASTGGSLAALLETHRAELQHDAAARERGAGAAWIDAFGRAPGEADLRLESARPLTYAERLQRHLARLGADADEYREVIRRAYALVVRREPYAEEFEYWRPHGALTFITLVACLDDWARRNQPGLMVTSGTPTVPARSRFVTIVRLSPEIAAEARTLLPSAALAKRETGATPHVLAVSAENLLTTGNMHLALVGSP